MEKDTPFTQEDLEKIEKKEMKKIVKENLEITSFTKPRDEAIAFMKERNELIQRIDRRSSRRFCDQFLSAG